MMTKATEITVRPISERQSYVEARITYANAAYVVEAYVSVDGSRVALDVTRADSVQSKTQSYVASARRPMPPARLSRAEAELKTAALEHYVHNKDAYAEAGRIFRANKEDVLRGKITKLQRQIAEYEAAIAALYEGASNQ